jgi:cytochrome c-type biogenesis protein CcmH
MTNFSHQGVIGRKSLVRRGRLCACLFATVLLMASASMAQRSEEAKALSKRLMCLCGCNQILGECNHIGCTVSAEMLRKLDERVARNEPGDLILQSFVQEYGVQVLAEPMSSGFSRWAWLMPPLAALAGISLVVVVLWRWRSDRQSPEQPVAQPRLSAEILARARRQADRDTEDEPFLPNSSER